MALDESSTQKSNCKYHVFLSFSGEDTRLGFTDHLYEALVHKNIITFRDDEELPRGKVISQKLLEAIEESLSAIVIISKNYASSTWCLDELQKIVESKQRFGREVFPVFYGVDPSDVRHQRGSFAETFKKYEEKFAENKEKVQRWRDALKVVANLSGWDSKNQHESKLIEEIVSQVWTKLEPKLARYNDGLVAIDTKLEDMFSHLRLGLEDVRFIGIWGMGGIGKTTLANIVFKKIRSQFDVSCFLANVREASKDGDQGLVHLQNKLLSHLKLKSLILETASQGKDNIRSLLHNKKVLLILDDVSAKSQLENLSGNQDWFGPGSRIIVTTRDKHLLKSHVVLFYVYEIEILNTNESLQLFHEKAFKRDQPKEEYMELSKIVVEYAGGLPLALEVLGSFLCGRSVHEWKGALIKLSQISLDDIQNKLKISYEMLEDEHKKIFLDIACFFKGCFKDKMIQILDKCGLHPDIGINVLIEKSLITCNGGIIGMHDLLEEMGRTLVLQESPNDPGRCSRLWSLEDINQVLKKNTGTKKIQGIVLKSSIESYEAHWEPKAFSKMSNLRLLVILSDLRLPFGLQCLSSSLKVLHWTRYPLKALPLGVQLDELLHLQMSNSKIKILWNGAQYFGKLKFIDLSNSRDLIQTPNISAVPHLEELYLDGCINLVKVHQSVRQHKKLAILSMIRCFKLKNLPRKLEMNSLKTLFLSGCSRVQRLPDFGKNMECVSVLNLMNCRKLLCLPNSISNLKSLRCLNISGCSKICRLPNKMNEISALEDLDLSKTAIRKVNQSLFCLKNLKRLCFRGCGGPAPYFPLWDSPLPLELKFWWKRNRTRHKCLMLPSFISGLSSLTSLDLSYCNLNYDLIPKDLGQLSSLETLILSGNEDLKLPADSFTNLSKLRCLEVEGCMLGSRLVLPPHARLYPKGCASEVGLIDTWKLWKLFESHDREVFTPHNSECWDKDLLCYEIPPRFDNQNLFPAGPSISKLDSGASITVDIPDGSHRGEWWGVAVFIVSEPQVSPAHKRSTFVPLYWSFEAPHPEMGPSLCLFSLMTVVYGNNYLITMIMNDNYIYIQQHQKRCNRNCVGELKRFSKHWKPEFSENSKLRVKLLVEEGKIRDCAWHVLCKEDFQFQRPFNSEEGFKRRFTARDAVATTWSRRPPQPRQLTIASRSSLNHLGTTATQP